MNLILCGYKASGKTTIAKAFSLNYQYKFIDTDDLIIKAYNNNLLIGEIYSELGSEKFIELEKNIISKLNLKENSIIATGGGAFNNSENIKKLKSLGEVIYLKVPKKTLTKRIKSLKILPRFIDPNKIDDSINQYLSSRDEIYKKASDFVIDTQDKTISEIIKKIKETRQCYG